MRKITYEEVKSVFESKNLTLISTEYVDIKSPLKYVCNKHTDKGEQIITLDSLERCKCGCKFCAYESSGNKFIISDEQIMKTCDELNFTYVGRFIKNQKTYVRYICNKHQEKGEQVKPWSSFKKTKGCPYCSKKKRTADDFFTEMLSITPNIEIRGNYKGRDSRMDCKCLSCGHEWNTSAESLLSGHGCWECYKRKESEQKLKSDSQYKLEMLEKHPNIQLLSLYNGSKDDIMCKCLICGNVWYTNASSLLSLKYGCPICATEKAKITQRLSQDEYKKRLSEILPDVDVIGVYTGCNNEIELHCSIHNTYFKQRAMDALSGKRGCPECWSISHGEEKIKNFLVENNILYISQHRFVDCADMRTLPFDFYLPDKNTCIEYDGQLHYVPKEYFGGEKSLEKTQKHDLIKTEYCKNNNINLIRIPYWGYNNVDVILTNALINIDM